MLVRALKMLGYFSKRNNPQKHLPRQPLISRAMKAALMAEPDEIGNDEPLNWIVRLTIRRL
jgi:hypothetical protein